MAYDKYYSKEEIIKRLRPKLNIQPAPLLDKFRDFAGGNGNRKKKLPLIDRRLRA